MARSAAWQPPGIRPINNIVDITNYVMEEYGQPMHAFDYDLLAGHEIVVKCAKDGDVFQTLDGQERKLDHTVLMINDGREGSGDRRYHGRREFQDHR